MTDIVNYYLDADFFLFVAVAILIYRAGNKWLNALFRRYLLLAISVGFLLTLRDAEIFLPLPWDTLLLSRY